MKKILSVLLAMAMIFSVMATGCINASAASIFSGAKEISAMDTISMDKTKETVTKYYKITLSDSGKIRFHCDKHNDDVWYRINISLLDSNGKTIIESKSLCQGVHEKDYEIEKKGTYYIKISKSSSYYFENFYYTFEPDNSPTISIGVYMDVGDTLNVAALASNYDGKVTWKTTKKAVATISKGKIKAKKAGKARIRAYMDNGEYAEIVVIVKDEDDD